MNSSQRLFADLTALLEDMHSVAVEGQASDIARNDRSALSACLRCDSVRTIEILNRIGTAIESAGS
jgi:hypothetical protein